MKKVLIVQPGFFPAKNYGGPPVSVRNLCFSLSESFEFYIMTQNRELHKKEPLISENKKWYSFENTKVRYLNSNEFILHRFSKIADEINPDILYLQSLFDIKIVLPTIYFARKNKMKLLIAPRGELLTGALKKKWKKIPYIYMLKFLLPKNVIFQGTSYEEVEALKKFYKNKQRIYLKNLPSPKKIDFNKSKKKNLITKFIFLSRIVRKKNLKYALEILKDIKKPIEFDIYGPIEDENYWKECLEIIKQLPSNIKVRYCGIVDNENVNEVFYKYDFFLFPTVSENYGHAIVEAMSSDCPVIISDNTPWNNINEYHSGFAISLNQKHSFIKIINEVCDKNQSEYDEIILNNKKFVKEVVNDDSSIKQYYEFFRSEASE